MKTISVELMRKVEKEAEASGSSQPVLMQRAGEGIYQYVLRRYSGLEQRTILGLVGSGNNGGDTLIAMAKFASDGWQTSVCLFNRQVSGDFLIQDYLQKGGEVYLASQPDELQKTLQKISKSAIIMDGILGTGIHLPLREPIRSGLQQVKTEIQQCVPRPVVIAVDCPSGMDCDSGDSAAETIPADLTLCLGAIKNGLVKPSALLICGEIEGIDIGLSDFILPEENNIETIIEADVQKILPDRPRSGYKGSFGKALIIGGSVNYTGAVYLAASGALRIGAGWVTLAVITEIKNNLAAVLPDATWLLLASELGVISADAQSVLTEHLSDYNAVLLGCGIGLEKTTGQFVERVLKAKKVSSRHIGFISSMEEGPASEASKSAPTWVIDADGLKNLSKIPHWEKILRADSILTPHPGEMALLAGISVNDVQTDRVKTARDYALQWNQVVVLKGPGTIIAAPDGRVGIIPVATSGLAHAGTGDVLAGMITGLRAQGMPAYEAAIAGAWIHSRAGLIVAERMGPRSTLASDLPKMIAEVIQPWGK